MDYNDKLKLIRPFITFNYDLRKNLNKELSPAEKRQITIYYDRIFGKEGIANKRGYELKVYRPKSNKNLNKAKKSQNLQGLGKLKAIPFPVADKSKARIKVNSKGNIVIRESNVSRIVEPFDKLKLITDEKGEVKRITDKYPKNARFAVLAGNFEITHFVGDKGAIAEKVSQLKARYAATYNKWMEGLAVYEFHDQADLTEYRLKINAAKRKKKRKKKRHAKKKKKNRRA